MSDFGQSDDWSLYQGRTCTSGRSSLFGGKPIAHARLGEQEARARRVWLELVPQLLHVDAQVVRLVDVGRAPYFAQQMPVCQHHAGMPGQASEQAELDRRQVNVPP